SPDGKRILFESQHQMINKRCRQGECWADSKIYVMPVTGGPVRRVTGKHVPGNEYDASWSPDGQRIAFVSDRNGSGFTDQASELFSVKSDGSCLTWLTNGSPASTAPAWNPAG